MRLSTSINYVKYTFYRKRLFFLFSLSDIAKSVFRFHGKFDKNFQRFTGDSL